MYDDVIAYYDKYKEHFEDYTMTINNDFVHLYTPKQCEYITKQLTEYNIIIPFTNYKYHYSYERDEIINHISLVKHNLGFDKNITHRLIKRERM
jgi:hypothetical protein